ncbi:MAG: amidohydrolase family protein [Deltaproteobacteria bacterium]|nr:amidohydrolase family protein [Deltaproteobacteria bacterium]
MLGVGILLLVVWYFGYTGPARPPEPFPWEKVIDMHCHTAGLGYGGSGCFISEQLQKSWRFAFFIRSFGVSRDALEEHGDAVIIQKISEQIRASEYVGGAVILAMDGVIGSGGEVDREATEMYVPNEFVAREVKKYDNLYFGASVNPYRPDALERVRRAVGDGAVLVKWIPSIMQIDPADERIIPFYREVIRLDLPLLCHTGDEHSFPRVKNVLSDPKRLLLPLNMGVTVIAAHLATTGQNDGEDNMTRLINLFPTCPTLYADISSLTQINKLGFLSRALREEDILERLMYGTDYPLTATGLCFPCYHAFNLTPKQIIALYRFKNAWDRDAMLKQALGVPPQVFRRSAQVLKITVD